MLHHLGVSININLIKEIIFSTFPEKSENYKTLTLGFFLVLFQYNINLLKTGLISRIPKSSKLICCLVSKMYLKLSPRSLRLRTKKQQVCHGSSEMTILNGCPVSQQVLHAKELSLFNDHNCRAQFKIYSTLPAGE